VLSPTTGLDHIDFDAAKNHNVDIFHLKGQKKFLNSISGTAEHTIALMLALLRKIPSSFEAFKTGQWEQGSFRGREVSGKTLGIVGYGRLGKKVARIGLAFGMKIAVYDPYIDSFPKNTISYKSFFNLLPEIDILSIHVPLLVETKHLIGLREIELMKPGSILINTSRGDVVSTQALIKALQSGHLAGAALDVIDREHCIEKEGHPLIAFAKDNDNLLVTPHIGGSTYESVEKTDLFILKRFFQSI
jgi:D-3-phosphoglycerate dehydrogenase